MAQETVFYMGCQDIGWVRKTARPMFISYSRLRLRLRAEDGKPKNRKKPMPKARGRTAIDSRGFVELMKHGRWTVDPLEYVLDVAAFNREVGGCARELRQLLHLGHVVGGRC